MSEREFFDSGERSGFSREQCAFMWGALASKPHTHTAEQIVVDIKDGETLAEYIEFMDSDESDES